MTKNLTEQESEIVTLVCIFMESQVPRVYGLNLVEIDNMAADRSTRIVK